MRLYRFFFPRQTEENREVLRRNADLLPLLAQNRLPQSHPLFDSLAYGVKPMSYNGCEIIACYHAQRCFDRPASLVDTAAFCACAGLWLFGLFGTHPHTLYTFCRRYGFAYRRYSRHKSAPICEDCILYSYWNPGFRGIHTVALYRDRAQGGFVVANHAQLRTRTFPTAEAALNAISAACPILCLGIWPKPPKFEQKQRNRR